MNFEWLQLGLISILISTYCAIKTWEDLRRKRWPLMAFGLVCTLITFGLGLFGVYYSTAPFGSFF
jgi:hypothetical protein